MSEDATWAECVIVMKARDIDDIDELADILQIVVDENKMRWKIIFRSNPISMETYSMEMGFSAYLTYVSMFPQLAAGPIVRSHRSQNIC